MTIWVPKEVNICLPLQTESQQTLLPRGGWELPVTTYHMDVLLTLETQLFCCSPAAGGSLLLQEHILNPGVRGNPEDLLASSVLFGAR